MPKIQSVEYADKLIEALEHPIRETRMTAIEILGRMRHAPAVDKLGAMLELEDDFYVMREILRALWRIDTPPSRMLLERARHHASSLVRQTVEELLATDPRES